MTALELWVHDLGFGIWGVDTISHPQKQPQISPVAYRNSCLRASAN